MYLTAGAKTSIIDASKLTTFLRAVLRVQGILCLFISTYDFSISKITFGRHAFGKKFKNYMKRSAHTQNTSRSRVFYAYNCHYHSFFEFRSIIAYQKHSQKWNRQQISHNIATALLSLTVSLADTYLPYPISGALENSQKKTSSHSVGRLSKFNAMINRQFNVKQ